MFFRLFDVVHEVLFLNNTQFKVYEIDILNLVVIFFQVNLAATPPKGINGAAKHNINCINFSQYQRFPAPAQPDPDRALRFFDKT